MKLVVSFTLCPNISFNCLNSTWWKFNFYSFNSYKRSLPSLIGLECETGIIDDCNRSLSNEVLPFSCRGIHMFVSETTFNECGSECGFRKPNLAIKKGWTKYVRFFLFFTWVILNFNLLFKFWFSVFWFWRPWKLFWPGSSEFRDCLWRKWQSIWQLHQKGCRYSWNRNTQTMV